jgi:hypothetical protein
MIGWGVFFTHGILYNYIFIDEKKTTLAIP